MRRFLVLLLLPWVLAQVWAEDPAPAEAERQAFAAVKTVKIVVEDPGHAPTRERAALIARNLLESAGFAVAAEGAAAADAEVLLRMEKKALKGTYAGVGERFTGSAVTGTWTFKTGGYARSYTFRGQVNPPDSFYFKRVNDKAVGYELESEAPFAGAVSSSDLAKGFIGQLRLLWGRRSLETSFAMLGKDGGNLAHAAEVWIQEAETDPRVGELLARNYLAQNYMNPDARATHVIEVVAKALEALKPPSAAALAQRALKEEKEAFKRYYAAQMLGIIGGPDAARALLEALQDPDALVQGGAIRTLGKLGSKEALEPLLEIMRAPKHPCKLDAAEALADLRDPKAFELLLQYFENAKEIFRDRAARALGKLGDPRAIEPLSKALQDPKDTARIAAAWGLNSIDDPRVTQLMDALLADPDPRLRLPAVDYFFRKRDPRCLDGLCAELKSHEASIAVAAAKKLAELGNLRAVQPLIDRLAFPDIALGGKADWTVANTAVAALVTLTGQDFGAGLDGQAKWNEWWRANKDRLKRPPIRLDSD